MIYYPLEDPKIRQSVTNEIDPIQVMYSIHSLLVMNKQIHSRCGVLVPKG